MTPPTPSTSATRTDAVWLHGGVFHAWGAGLSTGCGEPIQAADGWKHVAEANLPTGALRCYLPGCWGGHQTPVRRQYRMAA